MKKILLIAVALVATITVGAQNIAVVSPSNVTKMFQELDKAIEEAEPGSIIYLPGGGFTISDETKIEKKLTIMGVSHRGDTDNVDGASIISGNLFFEKGSSHSALIGVYVTGNINIGTVEDSVANFTARYVNANSIQVHHGKSSGMVINQCYLREYSDFDHCNARLENNILHSLAYINGGYINHNIITSYTWHYHDFYNKYDAPMDGINNSTITNNFILSIGSGSNARYVHVGGNCYASNNCVGTGTWAENPIQLDEGTSWTDIFKDYKSDKSVTISSDYHLKDSLDVSKFKGTDGTVIGIYGGSSFSDKALAPIPRIVSKKVDEQTDGSGRLQIEVTVKAQ